MRPDCDVADLFHNSLFTPLPPSGLLSVLLELPLLFLLSAHSKSRSYNWLDKECQFGGVALPGRPLRMTELFRGRGGCGAVQRVQRGRDMIRCYGTKQL